VRFSQRLLVPLFTLVSLFLSSLPAAAEKSVLWGDTHLHTNNSFDAYLNRNATADPATAYRYARGLPVIHPGNRSRVQIETALDFLVVADHAEYYGVMRQVVEDGIPREGLGFVDRLVARIAERRLRSAISENTGAATFRSLLPVEGDVAAAAAQGRRSMIPASDEMTRRAWESAVETADAYNEPGRFTALIGWEWSSIPAGANLHRVVMTNGDAEVARQFTPYGSSTSMYPEDLWAWLEETSAATGADFVAIPHNSNISKGYMFPEETRLRGTPIDEAWAKRRARWEPVVEATQFKGDSETHPSLSPDDPFADFETYTFYIQQDPPAYRARRGDYIRSALRAGLAIEERIGFNPYRFGLIGSTDAHTGLPSAEEANFWGKFPTDSTPESKPGEVGTGRGRTGWSMSASGLAAVWAESNTRDAILSAFRRREVFATTGPRILVRVFAGGDIAPGDELTRSLDSLERGGAVPMGGELAASSTAPSFLIHAAKDPRSGQLDRVQMVKGGLRNGVAYEKVYEVAWAGQDATPARRLDTAGQLPPLPDTVSAETASYSNEHGAASLAAVWTDPDFDPKERAFYYVRVLEVPTPRHSTYDSVALGIDARDTRYPTSIQERAYTSPIHYKP